MKHLSELSFPEVEKEIRRLVSANPDNVYKSPGTALGGCCYSKGTCTDGSVGCLLGQAFSNLGIVVANWDSTSSYGSSAITDVLNRGRFTPRVKEQYWLQRIQQLQDDSHVWSYAVEIADREHPLREEV